MSTGTGPNFAILLSDPEENKLHLGFQKQHKKIRYRSKGNYVRWRSQFHYLSETIEIFFPQSYALDRENFYFN